MNRPESVILGRDHDVLNEMIPFYTDDGCEMLDVTANARRMWEGVRLESRSLKFMDIDPMMKPDIVGDFRQIPLPDDSLDVIIFDPPHLPSASASPAADQGFVHRYGLASSVEGNNVAAFFPGFLKEAKRVLRKDGLVFAKLKDYVHNHRYQWMLVDFIGAVRAEGMTPCDLIIKRDPAAGNMKSGRWVNAHHVRNSHCWWVIVRNGTRCEPAADRVMRAVTVQDEENSTDIFMGL